MRLARISIILLLLFVLNVFISACGRQDAKKKVQVTGPKVQREAPESAAHNGAKLSEQSEDTENTQTGLNASDKTQTTQVPEKSSQATVCDPSMIITKANGTIDCKKPILRDASESQQKLLAQDVQLKFGRLKLIEKDHTDVVSKYTVRLELSAEELSCTTSSMNPFVRLDIDSDLNQNLKPVTLNDLKDSSELSLVFEPKDSSIGIFKRTSVTVDGQTRIQVQALAKDMVYEDVVKGLVLNSQNLNLNLENGKIIPTTEKIKVQFDLKHENTLDVVNEAEVVVCK